jgi:hypothetical protein
MTEYSRVVQSKAHLPLSLITWGRSCTLMTENGSKYFTQAVNDVNNMSYNISVTQLQAFTINHHKLSQAWINPQLHNCYIANSFTLIFSEALLLPPLPLHFKQWWYSYLQACHGTLHNTQCGHVCTVLLCMYPTLYHTSIASGTPHSLNPMSHCDSSIPAFVFQKELKS